MTAVAAFAVGAVLGALAWDTFLGWLHRSLDAATSLPAPRPRIDVRS